MAKQEISYEITRQLGVVSTNNSGWTKEVNLISWNGREPKIDIRDWNPDHSRMGKGITLTADDAKAVADIINKEVQ